MKKGLSLCRVPERLCPGTDFAKEKDSRAPLALRHRMKWRLVCEAWICFMRWVGGASDILITGTCVSWWRQSVFTTCRIHGIGRTRVNAAAVPQGASGPSPVRQRAGYENPGVHLSHRRIFASLSLAVRRRQSVCRGQRVAINADLSVFPIGAENLPDTQKVHHTCSIE
jgi:hypothetical protein